MYGTTKDADWFDVKNEEAQKIRESCNEQIRTNICEFFAKNANGVSFTSSFVLHYTNLIFNALGCHFRFDESNTR